MNIDRIGIRLQSEQNFFMLDTIGIYPKWRTITNPVGRTSYDTIPGLQGAFDSTEQFGEVFYNMRDLSIGSIFIDDDYHRVIQNLSAKYHCQAVDIMFANDPEYYWSGRINIGSYDSKNHSLTMSAKVFPFKFKMHKTVIQRTVASSSIVRLHNERMPVIPTITTYGPITLAWGNNTKALSASTYPLTVRVAGLRLPAGDTNLTITGSNVKVIVEYREATL